MGNLIAGAMGWNFYTGLEHIKQSELAKIATTRLNNLKNASSWKRSIFSTADAKREQLMNARKYLSLKTAQNAGGNLNSSQLEEMQRIQEAINMQNIADEEALKKEVEILQREYDAEQDKAEREAEKFDDVMKAEDMRLDIEKNQIEQELTLIKQLKDAFKDLFNTAAKDFKPNFGQS